MKCKNCSHKVIMEGHRSIYLHAPVDPMDSRLFLECPVSGCTCSNPEIMEVR